MHRPLKYQVNRMGASASDSYLAKIPRYLTYFLRCFWVFKRPVSVIYHYLFYCPPKDNLVELRNGLRLFLSNHPHDIVTVFVVFARQDYGPVAVNSTVVDIGANIGVFSVYAASMGAKRVYSYEPNSEAYEVLKRNIESNALEGTIVAWRQAVSSATNDYVRIPLKPSPYNQLIQSAAPSDDSEAVMTIPLEFVLNDHVQDSVELLKLDCEGAEFDILFNSNEKVLDKIESIRMEYHAGPINRLLQYLNERHFRMQHMHPDTAVLWLTKR